MLETAREIVELLPGEEAGRCVLDREGRLYAGSAERLRRDLAESALVFHAGSIRGAFPGSSESLAARASGPGAIAAAAPAV